MTSSGTARRNWSRLMASAATAGSLGGRRDPRRHSRWETGGSARSHAACPQRDSGRFPGHRSICGPCTRRDARRTPADGFTKTRHLASRRDALEDLFGAAAAAASISMLGVSRRWPSTPEGGGDERDRSARTKVWIQRAGVLEGIGHRATRHPGAASATAARLPRAFRCGSNLTRERRVLETTTSRSPGSRLLWNLQPGGQR